MVAALVTMFVSGLALHNSALGQTVPSASPFVDAACDLPGISPEIAPRLRCGTVSVSRSYEHPEHGSFKLAVVIVRSDRQPALPDPVVYISGGPGSPLTMYADYQARHPYAAGRDLILVDQRGVGRSEPSLCPDIASRLLGGYLAVAAAPTGAAQGRLHAAFMACRDSAAAQGISLDDFGTAATVKDFDQVRQALGIEHWNVVGVSYGTTVAMTLMARHPDGVRSAVLDSVYPPDAELGFWSARVDQARNAFFSMCERDAMCAVAYPGLAGLYRQALDRLDRAPLTVAVPAWLGWPDNQIPLNASLFEVVVAHLLYYPNNYPGLPRIIAGVRDGDAGDFGTALAETLAGLKVSNLAAHAAVECRDRPHYRKPLPADVEALERLQLYNVCADWSKLGTLPVIPAGTDIPTLVLGRVCKRRL